MYMHVYVCKREALCKPFDDGHDGKICEGA